MALKFLKHRWQKTLLIVFITIISFSLIGALLINWLAEPILSKKLKSALSKGTDGLYHADFSDVDVSILKGTVALHDLVLKPDTDIYENLKQNGKAPNNLYELHVKRFEVSGMKFLNFYLNKELNINAITINNPELKATQYIDKDEKIKNKDNRTLYQKIQSSLKVIHIQQIKVTRGNFKMINYSKAKPTSSELKELNVTATELLIDSATQTDSSRMLFCKDISTEVKNYKGKSANGLYSYKVKSLRLSTQSSQLTVAGIAIQPVKPTAYFAKSKSDRFTFYLDSVRLNNFDYRNYRKSQDIQAAKVTLYEGYFEVYSNPNGVPQATDRVVTFPNWAIRNLKAKLQVDTVALKGIDVAYYQYNKSSKKTGVVSFKNTAGQLLNITNKKDLLIKNNIATAKLTTWFMGKGKLSLLFGFNLTDAAYSYSYKGHLAPTDMRIANPATVPLGLVKITSGNVRSLDFDIHANQNTSTGKVNLLYNNLKVDVLKQDDEKGYAKKPLLSLLANTFVVSENNPDKPGEKPRIASVVFKRPANYPFFKTMWLALLSGMKPCAGVGKAKELTDKQKKEKVKALKEAQEKKEKAEKKFREELKKKKN
jgi:hypothetical protein